jgi:hypothetical protein
MAITDIKLAGKVFTDAGTAVNGATVTLLETGTSTEEAATTTNSSGEWSFTETSLDTTYDIKIAVGNSRRYILWSDEITVTGIDAASMKIRGTEGAVAPLYFFADQADDAGDAWRMQASASDTLAIGSDKASAGTIIDYLTITNGANAAASITTILGKVVVGVDDTGADVKFFGATSGKYWLWDESADGVVQIGTLTVGVDDAGHDVKFFGDTASAYMLWDTSADDLVLAGAAGIDLAGDIDVDGTANLDVVDIDGAVQIDATFTSGVDGQGYDTKFFGDTSGAYILWDTSADKLLTAGGALVDIVKDKLLIGGTAVTTTAAELNLLDTASANSVVNSKAVIYGSSGELAGTLSTAAQGNVTSLGTLTALTVDDVAINGKVLTMTGSSSDTVTMTAATNGAFSLVTVDAAGTDANIQITADGNFEVDATGITLDASSDIVFDSGGADFHFNVDATTICTMTKNGNSDFVIATAVQDKDLIINGNDGGSTITALTLDMSAAGAATFNDKVIATELDISGNMDIDGTSNLDAVDIDGNMQIDGSILVGVDDQGYDLKLYGDTASRYWHWDTSADGVVQRGTLTVGVNDTGHDVQFFGATSGKYLLWDESEDALAVVGSIVAGAATAEAGVALSAVGSAAQIKADSGGADHVYLYAGDNSSNSPAIVWTSGNLRFWGGADCFQIATDGGLFAPNLLAASASTDVNINGSNELHSVTSSEYYKYDKRSLDIDTNLIYQLQPRSYRFGEKKSDAPESWPKSEGETDDFGLTAEEVHRVLPELVNMREGKPYSVRYSMLSVLLLNEVKKLRDQVLV